LQDIFNLLPNMNVETLSTSLAVKGNDMMAAIYLASLIRSTLALHKLIDNKEQRMWSVGRGLAVQGVVIICKRSCDESVRGDVQRAAVIVGWQYPFLMCWLAYRWVDFYSVSLFCLTVVWYCCVCLAGEGAC
jgi:hypothetical protein